MFLDDLIIVQITLVLSSNFIDEETEAQKSDSLKIIPSIRSGLCLTQGLFCYLAAESKGATILAMVMNPVENQMKALGSLFRKPPVSMFTKFSKKNIIGSQIFHFLKTLWWTLKRSEGSILRNMMKKRKVLKLLPHCATMLTY